MKAIKFILFYIGLGIKAIAQFLHFPYASEITDGVLSVVIYFFLSHWIGIILFVWAILLAIHQFNELKKVKPPVV
jgi:hypothetical protein